MQPLIGRKKPQSSRQNYDDDFFDDMLGVFPTITGYAPKAGRVSRFLNEEPHQGYRLVLNRLKGYTHGDS